MNRPPAPEPLESIRAFVNTRDLESGIDALADPAALATWLHAHGLLAADRVTRADLARARELREALRALLLAHNGIELDPAAVATLNGVAGRAALGAQFTRDGTIGLEGRGHGVDGACGALLAIVVEAVADGTWTRLKACLDDNCHWAFYDRSRNRSSQWCLMAVCGNRNKARAFRARRQEESA